MARRLRGQLAACPCLLNECVARRQRLWDSPTCDRHERRTLIFRHTGAPSPKTAIANSRPRERSKCWHFYDRCAVVQPVTRNTSTLWAHDTFVRRDVGREQIRRNRSVPRQSTLPPGAIDDATSIRERRLTPWTPPDPTILFDRSHAGELHLITPSRASPNRLAL